MSSELAAPRPDDGGKPPAPAVNPSTTKKGRILLLEDDVSFCEVIKDCLVEKGYDVVAVQNGGEGVREVLASDFKTVLCDIMMPGLPGDMFYRAVERIHPALCQAFIFMTGHQNDARTNDFIKSVNGFVLRKPFPLDKMLDSIALTEVRRTFHSVFDNSPTSPGGAGTFKPGDSFQKAVSAARFFSSHTNEKGEVRDALPLPEEEPQIRKGVGLRAFMLVAFTFLFALSVGLWSRYSNARDRAAALTAERKSCEEEWTAISANLEKALSIRSKLELKQNQAGRIKAERTKSRWTPALNSILAAADARIELFEVRARGKNQDSSFCEVRLSGVASGKESRFHADQFRQKAEENLREIAKGRPVTTRFEQIEDKPGATPEQGRANFTMTAQIGPHEAPAGDGKEGR